MRFTKKVQARVSEEMFDQVRRAETKFGPTEGEIIRRALDGFLPIFLAGGARPENVEFLAKVTQAIDAKPSLKDEIEKLARAALRSGQRRAA